MFFRYLLVGLVTMAAFLRLVDVPDAFALESVSSPTTAQKGYVTRGYTEGYWPTTNAYFTLTGSLSVRSKVIGVAPYFQYGVGTGTVSTMATPNQLATCSNNCVNLSSSCTIGSGHHQAVTNRVFGDVYLAEVWFKYGNCSANSNQGASGVVRVLYNAVTQQVLHHTSSNSVFYAYRNGFFQLVYFNGNNLDYYRMESDLTWTLLGSVAKPATFQAPATPPQYLDTDAFSDGTTQPSFFYLAANNGQYLFLPYNDSSPVVVRLDTGEFSTNSFWDSFKQYFGWSSETDAIPDLYGKRPYGVVEPADDNFLVLSHSTASGTSLLAQSVSVHFHFMPETSLMGVSSFDNPKMYFARLNGTYAVWDVACVEPGYDICAAHSGGFKCQNALGNLGPNAVSCNAPVEFSAYDPGSGGGSSGSGSSGSGGTSGGSTTFDLAQYPDSAQTCAPKSFSGTSAFETSVPELDPASCSWRVVNSAYRCQNSEGYQCVVSGDSCLPQIQNPEQYASGSVVYSGDVVKYECSAGDVQCRWYSKDSCGPSSVCYADGDYCRVIPGDDATPDFSGSLGPVSFSGVPSPDSAYDISNLGAFGSGSVSVSGMAGVGSFSGVAPLTALTQSGFCDMFNSDGSFAYYSDGEPFAVTMSVSGIVPVPWVEENVVPHVDRFIAAFTAPVNNLGSVLRVFGTFPEGSKVCVLGRVAEIRYQSSLKSLNDAKPVSGFQPGRMGFFDYLFLFVFGVLVLVGLKRAVSNVS